MLDSMALWECKLFREIAATRSMSKGAAHCGVSQSAASQHVQEVERRLGLTVFDRAKRPLELTEAGKLYAEFCRDVLRREERFTLGLEALKGDVSGNVRVASIYSIGLSEMSRLQEEFSRLYPAAHLHVEYMRPEKIYEAVRDDTADLGLVSYPEPSREIAAIPWRDEEMQVAAPPSHPLAARAEWPRAGSLLPGAFGRGEPADALRQYPDHQGSRGAGVGDQHSPGAHHARRDRAGPAGRGAAPRARVGEAGGDRASQAQEVQRRGAGVSGAGGVGGRGVGGF